MNKSILVLCTGNSCRSQMAEGFLKHFAPDGKIYSAGTEPAHRVHPMAVEVMAEEGIDISRYQPKSVDQFLSQDFDYLITVCDHANETCPFFTGKVKERLHMGFRDPAMAEGNETEVRDLFRSVRNEMKERLKTFSAGF